MRTTGPEETSRFPCVARYERPGFMKMRGWCAGPIITLSINMWLAFGRAFELRSDRSRCGNYPPCARDLSETSDSANFPARIMRTRYRGETYPKYLRYSRRAISVNCVIRQQRRDRSYAGETGSVINEERFSRLQTSRIRLARRGKRICEELARYTRRSTVSERLIII